eukprot:scaffold491506_cov32-Prasinocladus_malaysianus.AAC.2
MSTRHVRSVFKPCLAAHGVTKVQTLHQATATLSTNLPPYLGSMPLLSHEMRWQACCALRSPML